MLGKLIDYDSDSEEEQEDQQQKQNQEQQKKPEEPVVVKRKLNLSDLPSLKPFKQSKLNNSEQQQTLSQKLKNYKEQEDNWEPSQDLSGKDDKKRQQSNLGVKMFKLSKPKNQLSNLGDEQLLKEKANLKPVQEKTYEDVLDEKVSKIKRLEQMPDYNKMNKNAMEKKIMGKMSEYLNAEVDQEKIAMYDNDNMFIDERVKHKYVEQQEQQEYTQEELMQQQEIQEQQLKEEMELIQKNNKRSKNIQNIVDLDQGNLVQRDWAGLQEKLATTKELIASNNIQMPSNKEAKGKNKIQHLAQNVVLHDTSTLGTNYQGRQQNTRQRYGW